MTRQRLILAAIPAHKSANLDWAAELKRNEADHPNCDAASERESVAYEAFWRTMPTTVVGMAAYFRYLQQPRWPLDPSIEPNPAMPFTIIEYMVSEDDSNAIWHCATAAQVCFVLNEAASKSSDHPEDAMAKM